MDGIRHIQQKDHFEASPVDELKIRSTQRLSIFGELPVAADFGVFEFRNHRFSGLAGGGVETDDFSRGRGDGASVSVVRERSAVGDDESAASDEAFNGGDCFCRDVTCFGNDQRRDVVGQTAFEFLFKDDAERELCGEERFMPVEHFLLEGILPVSFHPHGRIAVEEGDRFAGFPRVREKFFAVRFEFGEEHFAEIELVRRPVPWIEIAVGFVASVDDVALGAFKVFVFPEPLVPGVEQGSGGAVEEFAPERGNHVDPLARDALAEVETGAVVLIVHDGFSARGGDCVEEVADVEIGAVFSACGVLHDIPGLTRGGVAETESALVGEDVHDVGDPAVIHSRSAGGIDVLESELFGEKNIFALIDFADIVFEFEEKLNVAFRGEFAPVVAGFERVADGEPGDCVKTFETGSPRAVDGVERTVFLFHGFRESLAVEFAEAVVIRFIDQFI